MVENKEVLTLVEKQPYATVAQPGHKPDLMQVKMSRNSPGKDGTLHTVRIETARYSFYIRI
jgi:hypothetical protein